MERISKNFIKGDLIKSANEIICLSNEKKSIYSDKWGLRPASIFLNMSFQTVIRMIENNKLFKTIRNEQNVR